MIERIIFTILLLQRASGYVHSYKHIIIHQKWTNRRIIPLSANSDAIDSGESTKDEVYGSKFFGGAAEKEIFEDDDTDTDPSTPTNLQPFSTLFPSPLPHLVALKLNTALLSPSSIAPTLYSRSFQWSSELKGEKTEARNPRERMDEFNKFARGTVDASYYTGEVVNDGKTDGEVALRFHVGFNWPSFWSPRITLHGTSYVKFTKTQEGDITITGQRDVMDKPVLDCIQEQILPRFWDVYHLTMAPPAEVKPRTSLSSFNPLRGYSLYSSAPSLVLLTSVYDSSGRQGRLAQAVPNSVFSTNIKTVGPKAMEYKTAAGLEVKIGREGDGGNGRNYITWTLDVPSCFTGRLRDMLPVGDIEEYAGSGVRVSPKLEVRGERKYATVNFEGDPQDSGIKDVREKLYDRVTRDGHRVKMTDGRPNFFYRFATGKTCWVEDGLGMIVWEWRPKGFKRHEVGVELET